MNGISMNRIRLWLRFLLAINCSLSAAQAYAQTSIYAQSIQASLSRTSPDVELLLTDIKTSRVLANTFRDPQTTLPPG